MLRAIEGMREAMLADTKDDHGRETVMRAFTYAFNRIRAGDVKTEQEAKYTMAAFADGFCTGYHRGNGTACSK